MLLYDTMREFFHEYDLQNYNLKMEMNVKILKR